MRNQKGAEYPEDIMVDVFGKGGRKGRENYGLRFAPCERPELLNYEGAQLLFIAARDGEEGLEESLGEGRGEGKLCWRCIIVEVLTANCSII